jgi:hypothetical protein
MKNIFCIVLVWVKMENILYFSIFDFIFHFMGNKKLTSTRDLLYQRLD